MKNTNYDIDILVNNKPIRKFLHNGKFFVEARGNQEYTIKIKNNSCSRVLVVPSVDGINALSGEPAGKSKEGYVVNAYSSVEVKGWRTSHEVVHPFKFNAKNKSYAAKSEQTDGDTRNCGVIGVEVYSEKAKPEPIIIEKYVDRPYPVYPLPYKPWPNYPYYRDTIWTTNTFNDGNITWNMTSNTSTSKCLDNDVNLSSLRGNLGGRGLCASNFMATTTSDFDMGTEFSKEEVIDKVREVEFETGVLQATLEIYYASRNSLLSMGVELVKETQVSFPSAFPSKFCKPPR